MRTEETEGGLLTVNLHSECEGIECKKRHMGLGYHSCGLQRTPGTHTHLCVCECDLVLEFVNLLVDVGDPWGSEEGGIESGVCVLKAGVHKMTDTSFARAVDKERGVHHGFAIRYLRA